MPSWIVPPTAPLDSKVARDTPSKTVKVPATRTESPILAVDWKLMFAPARGRTTIGFGIRQVRIHLFTTVTLLIANLVRDPLRSPRK
jgi:hypothetical protein